MALEDEVLSEVRKVLTARLERDLAKMRDDYIESGEIDVKPVSRTVGHIFMAGFIYSMIQNYKNKLAIDALIRESKYGRCF